MRAIFLDIETTGLDPKIHQVIDIGLKIIDVSTGQFLGSYQSLVRPTQEAWALHDPVSLEINGYTWEQTSAGKSPEKVKEEIIHLFTLQCIQRGEAVFICQNPAFDRGFFSQLVDVYTQERLNWPYHWLDLASMFWAMLVRREELPDKITLSKNEIAKRYRIPAEERPHKAIKGVNHLILCYQAVLGVRFENQAIE